MIRVYAKEDLTECACLLMAAYNDEPWCDHWTEETGSRLLSEFAASSGFVGWVAQEGDRLIGAMFARRKTWWTNDELFVEELFVDPYFQGKGIGKALLDTAEQHCREQSLGGVTLLTNRHMPAKAFYEKNGYTLADHVVYFYKVVK